MRTRSILMRIGVLAVLFALAGGLVSADSAEAKPDRQSAEAIRPLAPIDDQPYQYMVKYVCGWNGPWSSLTYINIHNYTGTMVRVWFRPAPFYTRTSTVFPDVPAAHTHVIRPRRVLRLSCFDIWNLSGVLHYTYAEGMMHVSAGQRLPVVAFYQTSRDDQHGVGPITWEWGPDVEVNEYRPFIEP